MKTIRFQQVVSVCGLPEVYLTWSDPSKDPKLKNALKQHRVMTLHQTIRGATKDFGTIGLLIDAHAQILIFPRSLKKFSDHRVVGIDYSTIGESTSADFPRPRSRASAASVKKQLSRKPGGNPGKLLNFSANPSAEKPPEPTPAPPVSWKEIAAEIRRIKTAFQAREYAKASDAFQKIAVQLRP